MSTEALIHLDALSGDDWETALQEILRVDSNVLGVECVSYWRFRFALLDSSCELGYHQSIKGFDRGFELRGADAPVYFHEIPPDPDSWRSTTRLGTSGRATWRPT